MKETPPGNDWLFYLLVLVLSLLVIASYASWVRAEPDTNGILDSMIGYKVRDFNYNTLYTITPTPTGGFIVRDPKYRYPLFKIEDGKIYNFKREPQKTIKK